MDSNNVTRSREALVFRSPNNHPCRFAIGTRCTHAGVGGDVGPKCDTCRMYSGKPRGLGDVVAMAATVTGVAAVVDVVAPNCGCAERRAALNRAVPFTDKPTQD